MALNETGQLGKMLKGFENRNPVPCSKCGGVGFINCGWCFGSKKSITNKYGAGAFGERSGRPATPPSPQSARVHPSPTHPPFFPPHR